MSDQKNSGPAPDSASAPAAEGASPLSSAPAGDEPASGKPKHYPLWENVLTVGGIYIAVLGLLLLLTFGLFSLVSPASNPYVDIIGYLVIPTVLAFGVALMPVGILFKSWRLHRKDPAFRTTIRFPRIDLNDPKQRTVAKTLLIGIFLILPVLGVSGYHGYHYTDSVEFCAKACHTVMEPQSTAFQTSSHARVACAECHIGSGASWFVKSKLSGTRQVLAVLSESYSRPIPPAIEQLRPARDTCEQCHWPNKFFGAQLRVIPHFQSDEANRRRDVRMLVNTGGADESTGRSEGIHKHMLMQGIVEYVAVDEELQNIPWVRWVDPIGEELIYRSDGQPASAAPPEGQLRRVDCMDCHNRPAHKFRSPNQAVNLFMDAGKIDTTLPYVKREAVAALTHLYPDAETARLQIVNRILEFYRTQYPERYESDRASVRQAAEATAQVYRENFFPYMRVDWRTYPDNIGHLESPGCFRCHDGKHVNQYGTAISHSCDICHTFLNSVTASNGANLISEGEFSHPYPLEGLHQTLRCDQCHSGGPAPAPSCSGCHVPEESLFSGRSPELARFAVKPAEMYGAVECSGCHNLDEPRSVAAVNTLCVDCHDEEYDGMLAKWADALASARSDAEAAILEVNNYLTNNNPAGAAPQREWIDRSRATLKALDDANPLHNYEASRQVFETIRAEAATMIPSHTPGHLGTNSSSGPSPEEQVGTSGLAPNPQ